MNQTQLEEDFWSAMIAHKILRMERMLFAAKELYSEVW